MRLYTFTHAFMSSIQQGIQTAHIVGELNNEYQRHPMVVDWQQEHKTIIVCNGGNSKSINDLILFLSNERNPYPWSVFCEDKDSMEGMCTGVGIILPEEIYDVEYSRDGDIEFYINQSNIYYNEIENEDQYLFQLIKRIKSAPLAR